MSTDPQLLDDVLHWPDAEDLRRVYAERSDDPARSELIRLQSDLADSILSGAEAPLSWELREEVLLEEYGQCWGKPVASLVDSYSFHRGFIELVRLSADAFPDRADTLFSAAPIRHLDLSGGKDTIAGLFSVPRIEQVRSLSLDRCGLQDEGIAALAASSRLENVVWLSLAYNRITHEGVEALVRSPHLENLRYVNLTGNPCDPMERVAKDQGVVTATWMPPAGIALEESFGHQIPWLHRRAATIQGRVLGRFALADLAAREQGKASILAAAVSSTSSYRYAR
jgi:Leucine Rich Repeat (LRR) protein